MKTGRLLLRAACGAGVGYGHLMRLAGVADLFTENEPVSLLLDESVAAAARAVLDGRFSILIIPRLSPQDEAKWLCANFLDRSDMLVLDGYEFDFAYQSAVRRSCHSLVVFDDCVQHAFDADLLINAAGYPKGEEPATSAELLSGPQYIAVRREFIEKETGHDAQSKGMLVLSFGAIDSAGIGLRIVQAVEDNKEIHSIHLLTSEFAPSYELLVERQRRNPECRVSLFLHANCPAAEIASLYSECQVAIVSSSMSVYEACFSPCVVGTGYWVENQKRVYESLVDAGVVTGLGDLLSIDTSGWDQAVRRLFAPAAGALLSDSRRLLFGESPGRSLKLKLLSLFGKS